MSDNTAYLKLKKMGDENVLVNVNEISSIDDRNEKGRCIGMKNGDHFEVAETLSYITDILEKWHNRIGA